MIENKKLKEMNDSLEMKNEKYRKKVEKEEEKGKVVRMEFQEKIKKVMVESERLKEENRKLKENNDVQIRMWKVCLDKQDKIETRKSKNKGMKKCEEELIDEKELYEVRKERGFKNKDSREERDQNGEKKKERKIFCHFWNNGKCKYRDSECWYLHRESPECRYGGECKFRRCMFYHPKGESYHLNDRKQDSKHKYREDHYSSKGKQYGNYQQKVNRDSGESRQYGNYQQRGNWSVNGGNSRNYFRSEGHGRCNNRD